MALAIVGRPNVGKSSLFNRLVGQRQSLVWNEAGVTRDRIRGTWLTSQDRPIEIWDMAGFGGEGRDKPEDDWLRHIDLFLFVIDGSESLSSTDHNLYRELKQLGKPIILLVNKSDKKSFEDHRWESLEFAVKARIESSFETKRGLGELEDVVTELLSGSNSPKTRQPKSAKRILVIGRPNVGKSSLLNRLAGTHVALVQDKAGTTRDLVEWPMDYQGQSLLLVDTAGLRRKSRIYSDQKAVEIFSAQKTVQGLKGAKLCLFLVEADKEAQLHQQDKKILSMIRDSRRSCLILVNKWDQVRSAWSAKTYRRELQSQLGDLAFFPVEFISAKTGYGCRTLLSDGLEILSHQKKIATSQLNQWLRELYKTRAPRIARAGSKEGKKRTATQYLKFSYMIQTRVDPMSFCIFSNAPSSVSADEKRFLENELRKRFELRGIPIVLSFRKKS